MLAKKIIIPVFAVVLIGGILFGAGKFNSSAYAQSGNIFSGLAQAIASKFNLNTTDVQGAITAYIKTQQGNWQQNLQQREKQRLDKLVTQGKITNSQENAILNELSVLQNKYNPSSFKGMTQAQRQQVLKDRRNALSQWATANGIDPQLVIPFGMGHRGWHKLAPTPTP